MVNGSFMKRQRNDYLDYPGALLNDAAMKQDLGAELAADLTLRSHRLLWLRLLSILYIRRGNWTALVLIRLAQAAHRRGWTGVSRWTARRLRLEYGCFVQSTAVIGAGLRLPHPNGIVIGSQARIGARCTIFQQVTLGAARLGEGFSEAYPYVGDDVTIFAGAKLIGPVRIGDGAVIGANAVVTKDVPAGHRAVGTPAVCTPYRFKIPAILET